MRKIIIIIFILFIFKNSYSQNEISGNVRDKENEKPIAGVNVTITDNKRATTTDANGDYRISGIPNGYIKVEYSYIGYRTSIEIIHFKNNKVQKDILLERSYIETQEIVITGGYEVLQHETTYKIDIQEIQKSFNYASPNFMESITTIPGVDMISKGNGVSKPVIRGLSMNDIVVLNNGVRVENYQYSENHPLGLDEFGLDRVEVIKGPASLLYGSDAIGGVLNFIKEKPAPEGKINCDLKLQYHTNTQGIVGNLGLKGSIKDMYAGIRIGAKSNEDYLQPGGTFVPNSRFNDWSIKTNAGIIKNYGVFEIYYEYNKEKLGMTVPASIEKVKERGRSNEIWYQDLNNHLIFSQNKLLFGNINLDINLSLQNVRRKLQTDLSCPFVEMNLLTTGYESKLSLFTNKNPEYIIGINGRIQNHRNVNNRPSQFLPDANIFNNGIFGTAKYRFSKEIIIQAGLRYDYNQIKTSTLGVPSDINYRPSLSRIYNNLSGSLGAIINIDEDILLKINIGSSFRTPNISELTSKGMHGNRYELGNTELTTSHGYETDLNFHYHGKYLSFDITGFYNKIKNYIFISPTNDTINSVVQIYKFEQSNSIIYGIESELEINPKQMRWLTLEATFSFVIGKQDNNNYLPYLPATKLRLGLRAEKSKILNLSNAFIIINTLTAFVQDRVSPFETRTPGYILLNAGAGLSLLVGKQILNFGFYINNILDKKYFEHLSTLKPLFYNTGRNIMINVDIPIQIK